MEYNFIFTLDYEIHGNGEGDPYTLMIEPTYRLMNLLEKYNAKLTIMADVAEILCFKKYFDNNREDKYYYCEIEKQLREAIHRGHDVQLHIHSSYFKASYEKGKWKQYMEEYNMANLPLERIHEMVNQSIEYLNNLLKPINPDYVCSVFRAANWSMMPTYNIYRALVNNDIKIDTSVYKGGCQGGNVNYDYRLAYSNLFPYPASVENINFKDDKGLLMEYPIYTEMRYFFSFISLIRLFRMVRSKFHKHKKVNTISNLSIPINNNDNRKLTFYSFFRKSPWKFDFNQATGRQMINAAKRIMKINSDKSVINIVLIGHSKTFILYNEKTLEKFLRFGVKYDNIKFGKFQIF